jgi:hypothetical protein
MEEKTRFGNDPRTAIDPSVDDAQELIAFSSEWEEVRPKVADTEVQFVTVLQTEDNGVSQLLLNRKLPERFDWGIIDSNAGEVVLSGEMREEFRSFGGEVSLRTY